MMDLRKVQRTVLDAASRAGLGTELLGLVDDVAGVPHLQQLDRVDPSIREFELDESQVEGHVLLPLVPGGLVPGYRYGILAHAFRTRGYEPILLACSGCDLQICPAKRSHYDDSVVCDLCSFNSARIAKAFGVEPTTVGDVLPDSYEPPSLVADDSEVTYRGVAISEYAKATTRKYYKRGTIDTSDDEVQAIYERFLVSAAILADACERLVERHDVVAATAYEDPYIHGGVPLAIAHEHGIPAYSHDMGFRDRSILFGRMANRNSQPYFTDPEILRQAVTRPLSDDQREAVDAVMADRASSDGRTVYGYSANTSQSVESMGTEATVAMFTNLIWDASLELNEADGPFDSEFDWIDETLEYFDGRDVALVVKTHPAESVHGTNQSIATWIEERHGPLPSNVTLLGPDTDVDTYELLEDVDLGVVYNSTVGLEMAYRGMPVVTAGDTHYRDLGFTFDPASASEYRDLLDAATELDVTPEMRERARRYAHFAFVHQNLDFPFLTTDSTYSEFDCLPVAHDDLKPGSEPFDFIVERMVADEPVVPPFEDESDEPPYDDPAIHPDGPGSHPFDDESTEPVPENPPAESRPDGER